MKTPIYIVGLLLLSTSVLYAGQVTLTTYYPAPTGNYDQMSANTVTLNDQGGSNGEENVTDNGKSTPLVLTNVNGQLKMRSGNGGQLMNVGPWAVRPGNNGKPDLIYTANLNSNVGIGTARPRAKLDIDGDLNLVGRNQGGNNPSAGRYLMAGKVVLKADMWEGFTGGCGGFGCGVPDFAVMSTAVGNHALEENTGGDNSAFGDAALRSNKGSPNSFEDPAHAYPGWFNSAFGAGALGSNTIGYQNSAFGAGALENNRKNWGNSVFGYAALSAPFADSNGGNQNSGFGHRSLEFLGNGSYNTAVGAEAGRAFYSGSKNIFIGYRSGYFKGTAVSHVVSGDNNIFIGANTPFNVDQSNFLNIGNAIYGDLAAHNIGIGVKAPTQKLDVNGNINASGNVTAKNIAELVQQIEELNRRVQALEAQRG